MSKVSIFVVADDIGITAYLKCWCFNFLGGRWQRVVGEAQISGRKLNGAGSDGAIRRPIHGASERESQIAKHRGAEGMREIEDLVNERAITIDVSPDELE